MDLLNKHKFHIPVLGLGYTLDTPINVAPYGISSVISLVDDKLMEQMREFYCQKFDLPFKAISEKVEDFRAKRITSYLNLVDEIVSTKVNDLKKQPWIKVRSWKSTSICFRTFHRLKKSFKLGEKSRQLKEDLYKLGSGTPARW